MAEQDDKLKPPEESTADLLYSAAEAGLSMLGEAAGQATGASLSFPAAAIFRLLCAPPIERKLKVWRTQVSEDLARLIECEQARSFDELRRDEQFSDIVIQATLAAAKTSQQEKLVALENTILNSALQDRLELDMRARFVSLLDELTPTHLALLKFAYSPVVWAEEKGLRIRHAEVEISEALPALSFRRGTEAWLMWRDLWTRGLVKNEGIGGRITIGDAHRPISGMGIKFYEFISAPVTNGDG